MDTILVIKTIIMGIVEGLTEFLPISSTGHLILARSLLDFSSPAFSKEKVDVFEIVIQAGAILAVCWEYRQRIGAVISGMFSDRKSQLLIINLIVAFLPAAILGVLFRKAIKAHLFSAMPVATAFIVGGLIILWVERRHDRSGRSTSDFARIETVDDMSVVDAFKVGCAQVFALIPGTSRSGATIIGGMLFGLSRKAATEFSFFLAIPMLFGAAVYFLYKARTLLESFDLPLFSIGTLAAFISAFLCVRWLLRYISNHNFNMFAWYRIAFGIVILLTAYYGVVVWAN